MGKFRGQAGVTLVEIVIALAVFVTAASIMIGIETAALSRTIRDKNAQQAMLLARRILASVEAAGSRIDIPDQENQPASEVLRVLGAPDSGPAENEKLPGDFLVSMTLADWDLPFENIQNPAMRRLVLVVKWGDEQPDSFSVQYLFPRGPGA